MWWWEPWLVFRKPMEGRAQDNLRRWKTGGFRRPSPDRPFGDVIVSSPTRATERALAPHPSLKPQAFQGRSSANPTATHTYGQSASSNSSAF